MSKSSSIDHKRLKYLSSQSTLADYNETLSSVTRDMFGEQIKEAAAKGAKRCIKLTVRKQKEHSRAKGIIARIRDRQKTFTSPMDSFEHLHGNKVEQIRSLKWQSEGRYQSFNSVLEQSN